MSFRGLHTDRSFKYKLRATWMTPEVIRACSRLEQLTRQMSDEEALRLVSDAEAAGDTVIMVELDPDEGSGIIPSQWSATLGIPAKGAGAERRIRGEKAPKLESNRALVGAVRRDYNYDVFWLVFRLKTEAGEPLFETGDKEAELIVHINDMSGVVKWPIPESVRARVDLSK